MKPMLPVLVVAMALALCAAGCTAESAKPAPEPAAAGGAPAAAGVTEVKPSAGYPLKTCVVSGDPLPKLEDRTAISYQGTEVQFCCGKCIDAFEKDPAKYVAAVKAGGR